MFRTVRFPDNRSLGTLFVRNHSKAGWLGWALLSRKHGKARGEILVSRGSDLCLVIDREAIPDLSPLLGLNDTDLQALVFPMFSMDQDIAFYIQSLRGLELLRVELTKLTYNEVYFLKELTNLKWLYLFTESVSDEDLTALRHELPNCVVTLARQHEDLPHDGLVTRDAQYTVQEMMEQVNKEGFRDDVGQPFTDVEQFLLALELDVAKRVRGEEGCRDD